MIVYRVADPPPSLFSPAETWVTEYEPSCSACWDFETSLYCFRHRNLLFVPSQLSERGLSLAKTVTMDSSYISPLNLNHSSSHPLPLIPSTPPPLRIAPRFQSNRWAYHPDAICVVVLDVNELLRPSTPVSPGASSPSSPSSLPRWGSTSPTWSYASSTRSKSPSSAWGSAPRSPTHFLRRKPSPKRESLRALRAKDSDACLQRIYEQQTLAYLEGTMFLPTTPQSKLKYGGAA